MSEGVETLNLQDPEDFDRMYREQLPFVWRSLGALGVRDDQIEDLAHEVFIVLYRRLDDLDGRCQLRTWIYGIVRRVAANARRASARAERKFLAFHRASLMPTRAPQDLDRRVAQGEVVNMVDRFLDTLDELSRELFVLSEIEECSGREIAEMTGVNVNTVHARLRKLRARFERYVQDTAGLQSPARSKEIYV